MPIKTELNVIIIMHHYNAKCHLKSHSTASMPKSTNDIHFLVLCACMSSVDNRLICDDRIAFNTSVVMCG